MESDAKRTNGFADYYKHIIINNQPFSIKQIVARNFDVCDKFLDALLNLLSLKGLSQKVSSHVILILLFSLTDNSNFMDHLHTFVYEFFDCADGCLTYWYIVLEERNSDLIFFIKESPFDPNDRALIS